jgi:hypothetical protein
MRLCQRNRPVDLSKTDWAANRRDQKLK